MSPSSTSRRGCPTRSWTGRSASWKARSPPTRYTATGAGGTARWSWGPETKAPYSSRRKTACAPAWQKSAPPPAFPSSSEVAGRALHRNQALGRISDPVKVVSLNVGLPRAQRYGREVVWTAGAKKPVPGAVLRTHGFEGDGQADRQN